MIADKNEPPKKVFTFYQLLIIFFVGLSGCNTSSIAMNNGTKHLDGEIKDSQYGASLLSKEGMIITGFTGDAFYNAILQRGDINCSGGAPASERPMPPWCESGSKTKVRSRRLSGTLRTSDPRTSGNASIVMNMDLDSTSYTGNIWGTFIWDIPDRGTWEGSYAGEYNGQTSAAYRYIGHGAGEFQGMNIEAFAIWATGKGERVSGHIIEPEQ